MTHLAGRPGEVTMVVKVIRKETGAVEEYTLTGNQNFQQEQSKEIENGSNTQQRS